MVGIATGEPKLNEAVEEISNLSALTDSDYAFLAVDGSPIVTGIIPDFSGQGYTSAMMDRITASIQADLLDSLNAYQPAPEIDLASAIQLAVRQLNAHAEEGRQNILVFCCSGKSTSGLVDMTEPPPSMRSTSRPPCPSSPRRWGWICPRLTRCFGTSAESAVGISPPSPPPKRPR